MIYRMILLVLITIFYFAYFYKQIQLKGKGIKTNRLAKGRKPKATKIIETFLLLMTYGTAIVQYLSIFFSGYLFPFRFPLVVTILGLCVTGLGVVMFIASTRTMQDNWRAGVDEEQNTSMVTNGIYKYSRNPAFVGFDLIYIGTALVVPNVVVILFAVATILLLHLQILEEEKYLPTVFGEEYVEYKKRTPRYLFF